MKTEKRLPEHFKEFYGETIMTNFDHSIDKETAEAIKNKPLFSRYAGWNFNGQVWWDSEENKWVCDVWSYGSLRESVTSESLEEIMEEVSSAWGND